MKCKSEFIMEIQSCKRNIENWNLKLNIYGIVIWYIDLWEVKIPQSNAESKGQRCGQLDIQHKTE